MLYRANPCHQRTLHPSLRCLPININGLHLTDELRTKGDHVTNINALRPTGRESAWGRRDKAPARATSEQATREITKELPKQHRGGMVSLKRVLQWHQR